MNGGFYYHLAKTARSRDFSLEIIFYAGTFTSNVIDSLGCLLSVLSFFLPSSSLSSSLPSLSLTFSFCYSFYSTVAVAVVAFATDAVAVVGVVACRAVEVSEFRQDDEKDC